MIEYYSHRMKRLPDSPTRIALGFASGVFVSFTPFFGFHFVVAAVIAWMVRGNLFASALGTFVGNPITFPLIAAASIEIGAWLYGTPFSADSFKELGFIDMLILFLSNIHELVIPYFVGGLFPGIVCAIISFYVIRPLVEKYQARRRNKLVERAQRRIRAEAEKTTPSESS